MLDGLSSDMVVKAMGVVRKRPSENINEVYTVCCMCMYSCLLIHVHIYAHDLNMHMCMWKWHMVKLFMISCK